MPAQRLSIILATHNRPSVLAHTLSQFRRLGLDCDEVQTIVVDNASRADTAEVVRAHRPVELLRLNRNFGSCGKALALPLVRAPVVLFLDDDSYPRPGSVDRLLAYFDRDPTLGAAGFVIRLPDGSEECSALPHVFVGCGVGLRTAALRQVGGLDRSFFMQAEEYDLSFRLLQAGWKVEVFPDLVVDHLKTPQARSSTRTTFLDVANNLRVLARYLPQPYYGIYRSDWLTRYRWLAEFQGRRWAFRLGRAFGTWRGLSERAGYRRWRLSASVFERLFSWSYVARRMAELRAGGVRRITLIDFGKNLYAFYRGARLAGLQITGLGDDRVAGPPGLGRRYRGLPVLTLTEALGVATDALVVSNTSYVHARQRAASLAAGPVAVYNWFSAPGREEKLSPLIDSRPVGF